jgi:acyl carrier protein
MKEEQLKALIATTLRLPVTQVTRDADLIFDLCADSVSLAEITGVIERETGKRLSIDRLQEISTVGDIQDLLDSFSLENETPS